MPKIQSPTPLHQHSEIQYGSISDNRRAHIPNKACLTSIAGFFAEGENASSYVVVQHPPPPLHLAFVLLPLSGHSRATVRDLKLERQRTTSIVTSVGTVSAPQHEKPAVTHPISTCQLNLLASRFSLTPLTNCCALIIHVLCVCALREVNLSPLSL